jgi:hypothetical protein
MAPWLLPAETVNNSNAVSGFSLFLSASKCADSRPAAVAAVQLCPWQTALLATHCNKV